MVQGEFFSSQNEATEQLNAQGRLVRERSYQGLSWDEMSVIETDYMQAIIDASDIHALKFALVSGMKSTSGRDGYPDSTKPIHMAVTRLSDEDATYTDKFAHLLAKLLDPKELPPLDPTHDAHWVQGEQQDYRFYTTMLFKIIPMQPKSAELFEATYSLVTSGDPRLHGHEVYHSTPFTDRLLCGALALHQTDRRMQKTWEAALKQEASDDPDCLYPEPMRINPMFGLHGMIYLPNEDGSDGIPDELVAPTIEMLLLGLEKEAESAGRPLEGRLRHTFITLLWKRDPEDEARIREIIRSNFADNKIVQSVLNGVPPNNPKKT